MLNLEQDNLDATEMAELTIRVLDCIFVLVNNLVRIQIGWLSRGEKEHSRLNVAILLTFQEHDRRSVVFKTLAFPRVFFFTSSSSVARPQSYIAVFSVAL